MSSQDYTPERAEQYWEKTKALMWLHLAIWFIFSFAIHFFVSPLNTITFIGFPLGFYMAAQGSLIIFVVQIFLFAYQQNKVDEEFGIAEDA